MIPERRGKLPAIFKLAELLFFPSFCSFCSRLLENPGEKIICRDCWRSLRGHPDAACICCGRFFYGEASPHLCAVCIENPPPFACHRSCGLYRGRLKDIILMYKYRKLRVLGKELAAFALHTLEDADDLWFDVEICIPVPLHPRRRRGRGFNQAEIISRRLAAAKGLRHVKRCLVKTKNPPPQTSLDGAARRRNVKGAFTVRRPETVKGKSILLVDDVYTTGSTIRECASVLKAAGAREVRALTIAQAG